VEKIAAKQIDGVLDLTTVQEVLGRKQFSGGVGASNGASSHFPIMSGGYLYWVASPTRFPDSGDFRLGVHPGNALKFQVMQDGVWTNYCPPGCSSTSCFTYGTRILMADGSLKLIEEVEIGDQVLNVSLAGLETSEWQTFSAASFVPTSDTARITGVLRTTSSYHYRINKLLRITFEHPILVQRDQQFRFLPAEELQPGDFLFHYLQGWVELHTLERINQPTPVANIDIESRDTYFADLFLVHNLPVSAT
jgi:hypothetical protein